jgi:hypothetical protein
MTRYLVTLCFISQLGACVGLDGNGHRTRERRDVDDFVRIENNGQLAVQVRQGDELSVVVSIDDNLQDNIDVHVRDQTLILDNDEHLFDYVSGPHVLVTVPHLLFAHVSGSGDLDASGFHEEETLRLELSGSGDVLFEGSAPRVEADLDGSGDLRIAGSTDFAELTTSGSGDIDARNLEADAARLRSNGSGDIRVTVDGDVDADSSGSGDIDVYGSANLARSHEHGSGDITLR